MDAINTTLVQPDQQSVVGLNTTQVGANQIEITTLEAARHPTSSNSPASNKKRGRKMTRVKRSTESIRPGSAIQRATPAIPEMEKTLVFLIPANQEHGNDNEFRSVHGIANQLAAFHQIGKINSISIHNKTWELALRLVVTDELDDDQTLSQAFTTLMATINASPELCNGFCAGKASKWEYRIGNFVADEGGF